VQTPWKPEPGQRRAVTKLIEIEVVEMQRSKNTDIDPLNLLRGELVAARRAAAAAHDLTATVEAQSKLELLERAIAAEAKASH
jgi:hypothetical protein